MHVTDLPNFDGSRRLVYILSSTGLAEFCPPQAMSIEAGLRVSDCRFRIICLKANRRTAETDRHSIVHMASARRMRSAMVSMTRNIWFILTGPV